MWLICPTVEAVYFFRATWTTQITLNRLVKFAFTRSAFAAFWTCAERPTLADLPVRAERGAAPCATAAHAIVTILLDVSALYLRIASVIIPIPFGVMLYAANKIGVRGAVGFGIATAFLSVTAMLVTIGVVDKVPIVPDNPREWREVIEYALSIMLAYVTGNLLVMLILRSLPNAMAASGRPSAVAVRLARMFGQHVGPDVMRRRARRIQELIKTIGPLAGLVATAGGSIYTGLKGVLGH
jgi:hypothetical protein